MRARYYEANTGRFISEDSSHNGYNWYMCAHCNPITGSDYNGLSADDDIDRMINTVRRIVGTGLTGAGMFLVAFAAVGAHISNPETIHQACQMAAMGVCMIGFGSSFFSHNDGEQLAAFGLDIAWE